MNRRKNTPGQFSPDLLFWKILRTVLLTACLVSMLPMLTIYCFCQKSIIKGLTAGSVKG